MQEASFVYEGSGSSGEKAEINHDVTFREGLNLKVTTYTLFYLFCINLPINSDCISYTML